MQGIEQQKTAGDGVAAKLVNDRGTGIPAFKDHLHHAIESCTMHIHQKLHDFPARGFLRALRHLVKLRDKFSEISNLFLEFAAGCHTPPSRETSNHRCRFRRLPRCLEMDVGPNAKHRRVMRFKHLSIAQVHVDAAGQAWIETAYRPHDVNSLELVWAILLEN